VTNHNLWNMTVSVSIGNVVLFMLLYKTDFTYKFEYRERYWHNNIYFFGLNIIIGFVKYLNIT